MAEARSKWWKRLSRLRHFDTVVNWLSRFVWLLRLLVPGGFGIGATEWLRRSTSDLSLPVLVVFGFGTAGVFLFLWNQIALRRQLRLSGSSTQKQDDGEPEREVVTDAARLSATYVQGLPFRLVDIPRVRGIVDSRTFENCTIYGPAVIVIFGGSLTSCVFDTADGAPASLLWRASQTTVVGAIGLRNCTFRNCRFKGRGVGGSEKTLELFVKQVASGM